MLLGLTCGSKSDDYLTRKRLATAQTGKWRTNSNGLDWNGEGVSILKKREHGVPEKKNRDRIETPPKCRNFY